MSRAIYDALLDCDHARHIDGDFSIAMQTLRKAATDDPIAADRMLVGMPGCPATVQRYRLYLRQAIDRT